MSIEQAKRDSRIQSEPVSQRPRAERKSVLSTAEEKTQKSKMTISVVAVAISAVALFVSVAAIISASLASKQDSEIMAEVSAGSDGARQGLSAVGVKIERLQTAIAALQESVRIAEKFQRESEREKVNEAIIAQRQTESEMSETVREIEALGRDGEMHKRIEAIEKEIGIVTLQN